MKFPRNRLAAVLLAAAAMAHAAGPPLPDYLPADTKFIFGIRMKAIVQALPPEVKNLPAIVGVDIFHDVDEVIVATTAAGQSAPALAVLTGRFDPHKVAKAAELYRGVRILKDGNAPNSVFAVLNEWTLISGEVAVVRAAIDRRGKGIHIDPALAEQIEPLRSRFDIWGVGHLADGSKMPTGTAEPLKSMDRLALGVNLNGGLECVAAMRFRTLKDAEGLAAMLHLFEAAAKAQLPGQSESKFDVDVNGDTVKVSVSIPEAEWQKAMRTGTTSLGSLFSGQKTTFTTESKTSAPAWAPKPIMITEQKITTDDRGVTTSLTLPSGKR
jgi:hypothetical protein